MDARMQSRLSFDIWNLEEEKYDYHEKRRLYKYCKLQYLWQYIQESYISKLLEKSMIWMNKIIYSKEAFIQDLN